MEVTERERGISGEVCDVTTMSSNLGSVAHFLMLLGELKEASGKTSDTRELRLPVGELSYPLLEMEN